ncbi:MAG: GNAT family N-acetyltransferase [Acidobacteriaceae bacterium]
MKMQIRDAVEEDFDEITSIYNGVLTNSTAIYAEQPTTCKERLTWWRARQAQNYPFLGATNGTFVARFAMFGDFRPWPGYRFSVEGTIHIDSSSVARELERPC